MNILAEPVDQLAFEEQTTREIEKETSQIEARFQSNFTEDQEAELQISLQNLETLLSNLKARKKSTFKTKRSFIWHKFPSFKK